MFYEEYQLAKALRPANELDTYCRLEGLEPLYIRSILEKERVQKLIACLSGTRRRRVEEYDNESTAGELLLKKS